MLENVTSALKHNALLIIMPLEDLLETYLWGAHHMTLVGRPVHAQHFALMALQDTSWLDVELSQTFQLLSNNCHWNMQSGHPSFQKQLFQELLSIKFSILKWLHNTLILPSCVSDFWISAICPRPQFDHWDQLNTKFDNWDQLNKNGNAILKKCIGFGPYALQAGGQDQETCHIIPLQGLVRCWVMCLFHLHRPPTHPHPLPAPNIPLERRYAPLKF